MKDCVLIEIVESNEPWAKYKLADGTQVSIKQVVMEAWRVEDEFDSEGNPLYFFKGSMVTNSSSPEILKRKTS